MPEPMTPLSPEWWTARLFKQLLARRDEIEFYDEYYRGDHPLPWLAPQARDEFRRLVMMTRSNFMGLVVDSMVERLQVEGFRLGADADAADTDTWRIYQANNLDSDVDQGFLEAGIGGRAYTLTAPNAKDPSTPHVWVEHASQAIVEHEPGSNRRRRAAGLKVWDDDWTGEIHATLYTPDGLFKYKTRKPSSGNVSEHAVWVRREVRGEEWGAENPLGVVPLVELPNNPRLLTGGVSELADVTDIQDRINKTIFDRMQTQEFGVDPQKWAKAFPKEDEAGNAQVVEFGRNRMITTDVAETAFGNFAVAPLDPYSHAKREDVKDIASRTRTPAQYLLGEMSNVNGETLKASESGLVSKVRQRQRTFSEGLEETMRLARMAAGLPEAGGAGMETIWRTPEFRTEGELTDSVMKKLQSGIASLRQAREDVGYSATQILRLEADDAEVATGDPVLRAARALTVPDAPDSGQ